LEAAGSPVVEKITGGWLVITEGVRASTGDVREMRKLRFYDRPRQETALIS